MAYDRWGAGGRSGERLAGDSAYAAAAQRLRLDFDPLLEGFRAPPGFEPEVQEVAAAIRRGASALVERNSERYLAIAPGKADAGLLEEWLRQDPLRASRLVVTTPGAIRRLLTEAAGPALAEAAAEGFDRTRADLSAKRLLTSGQSKVIALTVGLSAFCLWRFGMPLLQGLDIVFSLLCLALVGLRLLSVSVVLDRSVRRPQSDPPSEQSVPVYTVLVALYDEAHMVADLVAALRRLDWPPERLDIKFIIEARDVATRKALEALALEPPFEILIVPDRTPRTKPKALAMALPLARGEFVTVYDAEDRPDPLQLREAHAAFLAADDRLACVQAPLLIENAAINGLSALFAMEYAVQFDAVLPTLAALGLPLPLGGTSNHFRKAALDAVGGWDPYNVTEDADLGIRFARFGYRSATILRPTFEEAPISARTWLRQRTRWLKGWLQTALVHSRDPRTLLREIGQRQAAGFLLTGFGSVLAALLHPVYFATALVLLLDPTMVWQTASPLTAAVLFLNLFNFVAGYVSFVILVRVAYRFRGQTRPRGALRFLPAYWLLQSLAAYRALLQLVLAPHRWEKTPHLGRRKGRRSAHRPAAQPDHVPRPRAATVRLDT